MSSSVEQSQTLTRPVEVSGARERERPSRIEAWPGPSRRAAAGAARTEFEALRAEVVRVCTDLAVDGFRGQDFAPALHELELAARHWATLGLDLDRLQQAIHTGFRRGAERLTQLARTPSEAVAALRDQLDLLESVHVRLTRAYSHQLPTTTSHIHAATRTLAVALLRGEHADPLARYSGVAISTRYHLIALEIPGPVKSRSAAIASRLEAAVIRRCGPRALSLLGVEGGTVLIPEDLVAEDDLGELIRDLETGIGRAVVAVAVTAATSDIADAGRQAHDFLDVAIATRVEPRLYRSSELSLYYQLTRPGPARDALSALLSPLEDYPELAHTLITHLANDTNRRRTASELNVHTNTLDYRLKRIHQITGCDPCTAAGLWRLRSALIVRSYTQRSSVT
ncbi:PucR family transcriptional regulator [Nocardia sp. NPDC004068]|uniref:PucR family transcriptional regulator n=1 Tax=Nocardia sp. NPDC004068 TaxID=3364303 RepID=UPI003690E032